MPSLQRSLLRYTADPAIVSVLDKHGNYLDEILDWEKDPTVLNWYLCSSYKMIDKIDLEDIVRQIFTGKKFDKDGKKCVVANIAFDVIKNRFDVIATDSDDNEINFRLDFSVKTVVTYLHALDGVATNPVQGQTIYTLRPNIDYMISKQLMLKIFYDFRRTDPKVSSSYPTIIQSGGFSLRYTIQ